jgi:hypothetical protein
LSKMTVITCVGVGFSVSLTVQLLEHDLAVGEGGPHQAGLIRVDDGQGGEAPALAIRHGHKVADLGVGHAEPQRGQLASGVFAEEEAHR